MTYRRKRVGPEAGLVCYKQDYAAFWKLRPLTASEASADEARKAASVLEKQEESAVKSPERRSPLEEADSLLLSEGLGRP